MYYLASLIIQTQIYINITNINKEQTRPDSDANINTHDHSHLNLPPSKPAPRPYLNPDLLSSSHSYTCSVKQGIGKVYCWGSNTRGECDVPPALPPVTKVDTASGFVCTLITDQELVCWGSSAINIPFLYGLAYLLDQGQFKSTILDFASGESHICAVRSDSVVKCWGNNTDGLVEVPQLVRNSAARVYAGSSHTCVVRSNGKVYCWGYMIKAFNKPFKDDPAIVHMSLGFILYGVTLDYKAKYYKWMQKPLSEYETVRFKNDDNELGIFNEEYLLWINSICYYDKSIKMTVELLCIVNIHRQLKCIKRYFTRYWQDLEDEKIFIIESVVASVSINAGHTCLMLISGLVQCDGNNDFKQLNVPDAVHNIILKASIGLKHLCMCNTFKSIYCIGQNTHGQTDLPNSYTSYYLYNDEKNETYEYEDTTQFLNLDSGSKHSCAVLPTKHVTCWGDASSAALSAPKAEVQAASLSVGNRHACAVGLFGVAYCWGWNGYGQNDLYVDTCAGWVAKDTQGTQYYGHVELGEQVMEIEEDEEYEEDYVVKNQIINKIQNKNFYKIEDGMVKFDFDKSYSRGDSNSNIKRLEATDLYSNYNLKVHDKNMSMQCYDIKISIITAGGAHTCMSYTRKGYGAKLKCVGLGNDGQVHLPSEYRQYIKPKYGVRHINAGYKHTCIIDFDNQFVCFGRYDSNKLDILNVNLRLNKELPRFVSGGRNHTCIFTDKRRAWCFGASKFGLNSVPEELTTTQVKHIDAKWDATCAVDFEGGMGCWGKIVWMKYNQFKE